LAVVEQAMKLVNPVILDLVILELILCLHIQLELLHLLVGVEEQEEMEIVEIQKLVVQVVLVVLILLLLVVQELLIKDMQVEVHPRPVAVAEQVQ
jgi:hypothetical protein